MYRLLKKLVLACLVLVPICGFAAEKVVLSGTIQSVACAQACGICCPTHSVIDTSGELSLQIGNSFVELAKFSDDQQVHQLTGYFYDTTGQCGIGECTLFAVEQVDQQQIAEPTYDAVNEVLNIQSVVINSIDDTRYNVTLAAPFNVDGATEVTDESRIPQGVVALVEVLHVVASDGLGCSRDAIHVARRGQNVHMVRHQDIGMDFEPIVVGGGIETIVKILVILFFEKDLLAVPALLNDVL